MPKRQNYSLKFFLNYQKPLQNADIPIYVRLIVNRKKVELSTKLPVKNPKNWNEVTQRMEMPKSYINRELEKISSEIIHLYDELTFNKKAVSAELLKRMYLNTSHHKVELLTFTRSFIEKEITLSNGYAEGTIKNYTATYNHIEKCLRKLKLEKTLVSNVDDEFIEKFDTFLRGSLTINEEFLKRNTCNKYHTKFKSILNYALQKKLISENPYDKRKFRYEQSTITFLSKEELNLLIDHSLGDNRSLIRVRDIFLFSVYTGCRWESAMGLKKQNLEYDKARYWINFYQKGTRKESGQRQIRLPLIDKAAAIIDKYLTEREITGYLLPRISNQKFNTSLKVVADLTGIEKKLHHHVARHTAATTTWLANKIPIEQVSRMLGHSDIKSTMIYARVTNEMLSETADELNERLK
jgi:integrase/recombinase XerD